MAINLKGRDYIETRDFTVEELDHLVKTSMELKEKFKRGEHTILLPHQTVFLLFFDKSTRTRNAFEAGATQLGAHAHFLDSTTTQISHGETAYDTGLILGNMGHAIAIRHDLIPGAGNKFMREVAESAPVPIINMQCDIDHPTQQLADLMTIREIYGDDLRGKKIAITWGYAPSYAKPLSNPQGLITLMGRFGMDVTVAHPPEFKLMDAPMEFGRKATEEAGGKFEVTDDMDAAFEDADIVYPKSWGCFDLMTERLNLTSQAQLAENEKACLEINAKYKDWICDERRMGLAKKDAIYMHCLPADRGYEVTDAVLDGPQSVVFQEAENRLHTAKAIMAETMRERPF